MVETITPVVHGGRRARWSAAVALHALGAGAAAAAFGAALGWLGLLAGAPWGGGGMLLVVVAALAYGARELAGLPVPIPERRRQVPQWWRTYFSPLPAAALYGVGLGVGFLTYLRHGTLVAVAAAATVSGDPATAALLVAPFGIARGLAVAVVGGARTSQEVAGIVDRLESLAASRWPRLLNGLALAAIAVAAAPAVGSPAPLGRPAALLLGAAFGWAALSKALGWAGWAEALRAYRIGVLAMPARALVPAAEVAVPILILSGRAAAGAWLALALLLGFSAAILRAGAASGSRLPCGCFGGKREFDPRAALARNLGLMVGTGLVLWGGGPAGLRLPEAGEALPAALALLGTGAGLWVVARSLSSL